MASSMSHRFNVLQLKKFRAGPKSALAPIDQLKQCVLSNYEKIHLHPGQCRAPRGL
jgi:hypothetical protein